MVSGLATPGRYAQRRRLTAGGTVSGSLDQLCCVTIFVSDLDRAKAFYQRAFDLPITYEDPNSAVFRFGAVVINLLDEREADTLIGPAVVAPSGVGARSQFTITVEDVNGWCATLSGRGVTLNNGPIDRPWGMRTASFLDPDGHVWEIAQEIGDPEPA